jgi:hypothetical protein
MKGRRPHSKELEAVVEEMLGKSKKPDIDPCPKAANHCFHDALYRPNTYDPIVLVCCHCGQMKWEVSHYWSDDEEHGPYVTKAPLPDNPYFVGFYSSCSNHGMPGRAGQRVASSPMSDPIGSHMEDSTVAKWLR